MTFQNCKDVLTIAIDGFRGINPNHTVAHSLARSRWELAALTWQSQIPVLRIEQ